MSPENPSIYKGSRADLLLMHMFFQSSTSPEIIPD